MADHESPAPQHRASSRHSVVCGVVTVSDTRTLADDRSGDLIIENLTAAGHSVAERLIVPDEPSVLKDTIERLVESPDISAILLTGGTGAAPRDQTPDTLSALFTRELPGFGELFRMLSYQEIGAAAMLSRAAAGMIDRTVLFLMPGSTAAVRLAMEQLILPELAHLTTLASKE